MINNIKRRNRVIELIVTYIWTQKHVNLTYYVYNNILYNYNSLGSIIMYTNVSALMLLFYLLRKPINYTNTKIIYTIT